jgi:DNA polymerase-3 subunit epsilon
VPPGVIRKAISYQSAGCRKNAYAPFFAVGTLSAIVGVRMKITVIDFETANHNRASACSVGIAVIEAGEITTRVERLIKPPKGFGWFREDFIGIHGLTHEHVRDAPGFDTVFQELRPYFENTLLAAHYAAFDMGVLGALLGHYGITYSCDYFCTLAASRVVWPELPAHNLATVARHLCVDLDHHHAGSDAHAAARMILSMLEEKKMDRLQMIVALTKRFESGNAVTPKLEHCACPVLPMGL